MKLNVFFWGVSSLIVAQSAFAGPPLSLSGPYPSIPSSLNAGDADRSYVYTISNTTPKNIDVSESITGNSTSVSVSQPCRVVPAHGSCQVVVTLKSTLDDGLNGGIGDTLVVSYNGRLPSFLTSAINLTVILPTLTSIFISPAETQTALGGSQVQYTATGSFANGLVADMTTLATWSCSTSTPVAYFPIAHTGKAFTAGTGTGTCDVNASFNNVNASNNPVLNVNNFAFINNNAASTVSSCTYSSTTSFTDCSSNTAGVSGNFSGVAGLALNSSGTFVYIASAAGVNVCSVSAQTGELSNCQLTYSLDNILSIVVDPGNRFAFFTTLVNNTSGVYSCTINQTDGTLSDCYYNVIGGQSSVTLAIDKSGEYLYVGAPYNGSAALVHSCLINQSNGVLTCTLQTNTGIPGNWGLSAAAMSFDSSYVYFGNTIGYIYECPVINGSIYNGCSVFTDTNYLNNAINAIVIKTEIDGTVNASISVSSSNTLVTCPVVNHLLTSNCSSISTSSALDGPFGLAIR